MLYFQPRGDIIYAGICQIQRLGGHSTCADIWSHGGEATTLLCCL